MARELKARDESEDAQVLRIILGDDDLGESDKLVTLRLREPAAVKPVRRSSRTGTRHLSKPGSKRYSHCSWATGWSVQALLRLQPERIASWLPQMRSARVGSFSVSACFI